MNYKKLNCKTCGYEYCPFHGTDREIPAYFCEDYHPSERGKIRMGEFELKPCEKCGGEGVERIGRVFQFSGYGNPKPLGTAVPVPPHGRLIDADAMIRDIEKSLAPSWYIKERNADMVKFLSLEDTVIPASEDVIDEAQRDYQAAADCQQYCETYEQTYNPDTGAM